MQGERNEKGFCSVFVLAFAFMSINSSKVMAYGNHKADLYTSGGSQLLNYVGSKQPLYNDPGNPKCSRLCCLSTC